MILLNSLTFFAFAVSRTEFYSLAKRICLLAKREFNGIIHVQPPVFRINSFSRSISLSWNQALSSLLSFQERAKTMFRYCLQKPVNKARSFYLPVGTAKKAEQEWQYRSFKSVSYQRPSLALFYCVNLILITKVPR